MAKGAYVLDDAADFQAIIIATGSELMVASQAAAALAEEGLALRVVSMPSWELFEEQSAEYKEQVLPSSCRRRITLEAGTTFGWSRYAGDDGLSIGLDNFGDSGPAEKLAEEYGFTPEKVAERVRNYLRS